MGQSNWIAFALFAMFVIFITGRGELQTYMGFLGIGTPAGGTASGAPVTTSSSSGAPSVSSGLGFAGSALKFLGLPSGSGSGTSIFSSIFGG